MPRHHRPIVLGVLLLFLLSGLPLGPVPSAAEGGPECGVPAAPCEIGPGEHSGTLHPALNRQDHYAFTPPSEPAVIRIEGLADATVLLSLYDPQGRLRASDFTVFDADFHMSAVARPEGEWRMEIGYFGDVGLLLGNSYEFTLDWTLHDHVEEFALADGDARSVRGVLPDNTFSRFEIHHTAPWTEDLASLDTVSISAYQVGGFFGGGRVGMGWGPGGGDVRTWGALPEDLDLGLPPSPLPLSESGLWFWIETDGFPETIPVDFGRAHSRGLADGTAWLVWDGDRSAGFQERSNDHAFFHRPADLEGDGDGLVVGPYVNAGGVGVTEDLSADRTNILGVNARNPTGATEPMHVDLIHPDGTQEPFISRNDVHFYAPSGPWEARLEHMDGLDGGRILFFGASFEFQTPW